MRRKLLLFVIIVKMKKWGGVKMMVGVVEEEERDVIYYHDPENEKRKKDDNDVYIFFTHPMASHCVQYILPPLLYKPLNCVFVSGTMSTIVLNTPPSFNTLDGTSNASPTIL